MMKILFLTVVLSAFFACSQNDSLTKPMVELDVDRQIVKRVTKANFNLYMSENSDYILVDIRTPQEFEKGTIQDAININYNNSNFKKELNKLDKTKPILFFCQSGGRSGRALPIFKLLGFKYVLELEGGYGQY